MPSAAEQHSLTPYRYLKWRWLRFRRSWTDTRADRIPSWSRLYLRVYTRLLILVTLRGATQTQTLQFGPDVELHDIKVGDTIHAVFVSAAAVQVTPQEAVQ